jgi:hypothetical protein
VSAEVRCADLSELAGEELGGTATTAEHWLLVEVPGTWQRDVSSGEGLPGAARDTVRSWLAATASSRVLFVRRAGRVRVRGTLAFVVRAGEQEGRVRRFALESPAELAEHDLALGGEPTDASLVLVCGHGARDACCALRGTALYGALSEHLDRDQLWLSSHQGGHRFAANVLVLPGGVHLGRVTPDEAVTVVRRALAGTLELPRYRGRVAYPARVQAAELAVRTAAGLDSLADVRLVEADGESVRFRGREGREYTVLVEERVGPVVPASCGADAEPQRGFSARLV